MLVNYNNNLDAAEETRSLIEAENGIADKLALAKAEENSLILCAGQGGYENDALADTRALSAALEAAGLPAHCEIWGSDVSHDWYWWGKELNLFAQRVFG